jgi:hypothetical protein
MTAVKNTWPYSLLHISMVKADSHSYNDLSFLHLHSHCAFLHQINMLFPSENGLLDFHFVML